uniref:Kelch like family member 3 n=1 Tax=Falco tinnunculus TaxID=100819 RepID=A0A8C4ULF8_FALTI
MEEESIKQSSRSSEAAEDEKDQRTVTVNPSHMRKAFKVMNELRSKRLLCDVVIVAETVEMEAHRVVLAACSPYFCAMFTGDMSESKAKKIEIKDVDGQTLRKLIDYIYTAEIEVTEENVQVLLPAASLLQLMDVRKNCCDFLQSQLHPTNCLGIRAFADVHACTELLQQANAYAGKLYAVGGYDGASRQCLSTVEQYNPATNEWTYVADMSTRRSGAGVGVLSGLLYATGGHDGPLVRKSVEVYDPGTNTWKQVADMNMCRRNAGVCAVNGLLYVVGGDDGSCNLASVEYYNPITDKWTLLPTSMSTGRSYAGVAVIHKPL